MKPFLRSDLFPTIPNGDSLFLSQLSIREGEEGPDLAATDFTFFDCNVLRCWFIWQSPRSYSWSGPPPDGAPPARPHCCPVTGAWTGTSAPTTRPRTAGKKFFIICLLWFLFYLQERHLGHWRTGGLLSKGVEWNFWRLLWDPCSLRATKVN